MNLKRLRLTILLGLLTALPCVSQAEAAAGDPAAGDPAAGDPAAGAPDDTEGGETPDGAATTEPQPARAATTRRTRASGNFRPSEDITADNSVAYPVDI
ncbi:MAG: hypothetical protein QGH75_06310 [Pseudomonadales bacterium]|nr:hypothetical protein [Pseudomonadales bacterium]